MVMKKLRSPEAQNQIWTILSAGVSATFVTISMLITTRLLGLAAAGILAHAAAILHFMQHLIVFGVRNFQGTDVRQKYRFKEYLMLRTFTAILASLALLATLIIGSFDIARTAVVLTLFLVGLTDMYADVFMGDLQQKGKMRVAGRMRTTAFVGALLVFGGAMLLTQSLFTSLASALIVVLFTNIIWIWSYRHHFGAIRIKTDFRGIRGLLFDVLPVAVVSLLTSYLVSSQKYFIGAFISDEAVAIFAILVMPVSILILAVVAFFGGAEITKIAGFLASGQLNRFSAHINKGLVITALIAIPFVLCIYYFGTPLFSWLYNTDLTLYARHIALLSLGGALWGIVVVLDTALICMRRQQKRMKSYIISAFISGPISLWLVYQHGINGAAFAYIVIFAPLIFLLFIDYRIALTQYKRNA